VRTDHPATDAQRKFDFSPPRPRPFLSNLPARIDSYEEGVARFFQWRTGLDYYATIDQVVDFVINTRRLKVADLLTDTGTFALRLAGRKAFAGKLFSFDTNITLLERTRQRARHMSVDHCTEFREFQPPVVPLADGSVDVAVSVFDLHRQSADVYLQESARILAPQGHLILAEVLEPDTGWARLRWFWKKLNLRYVQKKPSEAEGVYCDREEMSRKLFSAGFRQVIIQGLKAPASRHEGVFSLIAATK
jgi:ubiquinone/menaquinone biosynthesis C-methylase UbiE